MSVGRRVAGLEARRPTPHPPPSPAVSFPGGLSAAEAAEFRALAGRVGRKTAGRPPRRAPDLGALSCAEVDRLGALLRAARGLPPKEEPAYPNRGHGWRPCAACAGRCAGPAHEEGGG